MKTELPRELERKQWQDLARVLCLMQLAGHSGSVSVSKRFLKSTAEEVESMARTARYLIQEYGLAAQVELDGNGILLRIDESEAVTVDVEPSVTRSLDTIGEEGSVPRTSRLAPFFRFLKMAHL
jgi:hypothetical protein